MDNNFSNLPEDFISNVESKVKIKLRKRKTARKISAAALVAVLSFSIVFNQQIAGFAERLLYGLDSGVQLAVENQKGTRLDKAFTIDGVTITFTDMLADETGTAITFRTSDKQYSVSPDDIRIFDKAGKPVEFTGNQGFGSGIGDGLGTITLPSISGGVEAATVKIGKIYKYDGKTFETIPVNWEFKTDIKYENMKHIAINKRLVLDRGTLILENADLGVMSTELNYSFEPKDKNICMINLNTYIKAGDKVYSEFGQLPSDVSNHQSGKLKFAPIIYDDVNKLDFILLGIAYNQSTGLKFDIDTAKLPMTINVLGSDVNISRSEITPADNVKDARLKLHMELSDKSRSFDMMSISFDYDGAAYTGGTISSSKPDRSSILRQYRPDSIINPGEEYSETYNFTYGPVAKTDSAQYSEGIKKIKGLAPELSSKLPDDYKALVGIDSFFQKDMQKLTLKIDTVENVQLYGEKLELDLK